MNSNKDLGVCLEQGYHCFCDGYSCCFCYKSKAEIIEANRNQELCDDDGSEENKGYEE